MATRHAVRTMLAAVLAGLVLLCLSCLSIPAATVGAQETFSVRLNNRSYGSTYVTVYDHTCRTVVYQGRITDQGMMAISVCRARGGKAAVTIYDRRGRNVIYRDLVRGTSINIRFR